MTKQKLYFGGVPVEPDVKMLRERFSPLTKGKEFFATEVEEVLGLKRDEKRYETVVQAWLKRENEESGVLIRRKKCAFVVQQDQGIFEYAHDTAAKARSMIRNARKRIFYSAVESESEDKKIHTLGLLAQTETAISEKAARISLPSPTKTKPLLDRVSQ